MENSQKIAILRNEVEANLLDAVLLKLDVPHIIQSYYDAAYDGLFQVQKGWGCVIAPENYKAQILEILSDLRKKNRK